MSHRYFRHIAQFLENVMNLQKQKLTAEFKREQAGVGIRKGEEMHLHIMNVK